MGIHNHKNKILNGVTMLGDVAIAVSLYSWFLMHEGVTNRQDVGHTVAVFMLIYGFTVYNGGVILYKRESRDFQIPLLVLRNILWSFVFTFLIFSVCNFAHLSFVGALTHRLAVLVFSSSYRLAIRKIVKYYRRSSKRVHHVVFVGSGENMLQLYKEFTGVTYFGYKVMGYFDYQPNPILPDECPYLGTPDNVMEWLTEHKEVHELYCCLPSRYRTDIVKIINHCMNNVVHFYSVPNVSNYLHHRMYFNMIGSVPYLSFFRDPLSSSVQNRVIKRTFDIVFSLTFLCTIFPIVLLVVAVITKITMPGPLFFRQKRNGLNDKVFYCIKFRSMKVNDDADKVQATKDDPRKTKWGNIMRKTNIDELPQFINVLLGDMSVVGPRPHMLKHTEEYSQLIDKYMVRHFVRPGITGWSQVTGFRGETKELSQMEGRVKGDIWYIEHWTFWLDLYIIFKTIANAIRGEKEAY